MLKVKTQAHDKRGTKRVLSAQNVTLDIDFTYVQATRICGRPTMNILWGHRRPIQQLELVWSLGLFLQFLLSLGSSFYRLHTQLSDV
jgi:hypothetical protein